MLRFPLSYRNGVCQRLTAVKLICPTHEDVVATRLYVGKRVFSHNHVSISLQPHRSPLPNNDIFIALRVG